MRTLRQWLTEMWSWLTYTEPRYETAVGGSRDRSLRGKARRRARRSA